MTMRIASSFINCSFSNCTQHLENLFASRINTNNASFNIYHNNAFNIVTEKNRIIRAIVSKTWLLLLDHVKDVQLGSKS